jgi:hypothetical protein
MEKGQVATGYVGIVGGIIAMGYKLTLANPVNIVAAFLRFIAALENLEMCAKLHQFNVEQMEQQREQLQREVDQLQRQLQQQQSN